MATYQARGARIDFNDTSAAGGQGLARVVGLRDGGFGVSWIGADSDRTSFDGDVFGLVFSADLTPTTSSPIQLITDTGPSNSYPVNQAVTHLAGGGFALFTTDDARYDPSSAAGNRDVAVRLFDAAGSEIGQPIYLGAASILGVTITTLTDGRLIAGWIDAGGALRAQYLTAQGIPTGESFEVAKPNSDFAARPDFSAVENGGWIATYVAQNSGEGHAIFFGPQGNPLTDKIVATSLSGIEGVQSYDLADNRSILVWTQQAPGHLETHARIYSPDGTPFGSELTLSTTSSSAVSVTGLADGGFAVALEPAASGPLEVKVYNSIGQQNGSTLTFAGGIEPSIAALADGGFTVVWKDSATDQFHAQAYQPVSAGNLTLNGGAGADTLVGQEGADVLNGLAGADQLFGSVGNDQLNGGDGNDLLDGGAGNDLLIGGTGVDIMVGGEGDDYYFVDNAGDQIFEAANGGHDNVAASVDYRLQAGSYVEILSTNSNSGTASINLFGNELANIVIGNAGNNIIDGGAGADKMQGLGGDDYYFVDNANDQIFEVANGGYDNVAASVSYRLGAGVSVEVLSTNSNSGTAAINLFGNELANIVIGNAGNNILDGGAGADKMQGLGGDDYYFVDNAGDQIFEVANGGIDNVAASVSYKLQAGVSVEFLQTTNHAGTAAINLTGNELANSVIGNAGNNVLDGGSGADKLQGLGGDDTYFVDNTADQIFESANGGHDLVATSVSYTLQAGVSIEVLQTTSNIGTAAINLTGNEQANNIIGNAGANTIDGGGGADNFLGLGGSDTFVLHQGQQSVGILDFTSGSDKISLKGFSDLQAGTLSAGAFGSGAAATTASERILYDSATGSVFYDSDGNGVHAAVQIAQLTAHLTITHNDFIVG